VGAFVVVEGELHALGEVAGIVVIDVLGEVALEDDKGWVVAFGVGVEGELHTWD